MHVIKIVGLADGQASPWDKQWLKSFDFVANDGWGWPETTPDVTQAKTFASGGDAMIFWKQQSEIRPLRPDGKPNRPLTAFTVEIHDQAKPPLL